MNSTLPADPLAATVYLRMEELRREAAADRVARTVRRRRTPTRGWPANVARALRASFTRPVTGSRRGAVCTTC